MRAEAPPVMRPAVPLAAWAGYFLRLGTLGFGGPIALSAAMQRDLVELRGWVTPTEYLEGLALAQLAPGPLAAQLAIYLGWLRRRVLGATVTGVAFVAPSLVMVLVLAWLYLRYGGLQWMQAAFYGIGAAVIAVIARGTLKLAERTVGRDPLLAAVLLVNSAVVVWTARELLWVFLLSGIAVPLIRRWNSRPAVPGVVTPLLLPWAWWTTGLHGPADPAMLARVFGYFAKAALVVFGSGLAVVPFLHGGVVESFGWLTDRQFLDAVAVSMITPGPVVITWPSSATWSPARSAVSWRRWASSSPPTWWSFSPRPGSAGSGRIRRFARRRWGHRRGGRRDRGSRGHPGAPGAHRRADLEHRAAHAAASLADTAHPGARAHPRRRRGRAAARTMSGRSQEAGTCQNAR